MVSKRIEGGEREAFLLVCCQRLLVGEKVVTITALFGLFMCCFVFVWSVRDVVFVLSFLRRRLR